MKKRWLVSAGVAGLLAISWFLLSDIPTAKTTGNVLKHEGTLVEGPSDLSPVEDSGKPRLNFTWHHGSDVQRPFHTDGENVVAGAAPGDPLKPNDRYRFYRKDGDVIVRRSSLWHWLPYFHRRVDLMHDGTQVAATAFASEESFDLGTAAQEGSVVIAVTTKAGDDPPKKRLYRIRISELEEKLP